MNNPKLPPADNFEGIEQHVDLKFLSFVWQWPISREETFY